MNHKNRQFRRQLIDQEMGTIRHSWQEQRYRVALVYPNSYHQGMSNLGFQTVYHLLNQRSDSLCERFFYQEEGLVPCSLESGRPLRDFDLVALSISFENDYLNLPFLFDSAGIPLYAVDRSELDPLIIFGGACAFINPEPLADVVDLVAVGEAEAILPLLMPVLIAGGATRNDHLELLAEVPGIYVPGFYRPRYSPSGVTFERSRLVPFPVVRQYPADLSGTESRTFIYTNDTEFGHMALTEVSRGCSRGCRFCAAGFIYLPPRERPLDEVLTQVDAGLCRRNRVGLVAAAVADYSEFAGLQQEIIDRQGELSVSSLRLDALDGAAVALMKQAGHTSVAIAPEAGSQRLRDLINKGINEEQILNAVGLLADGGINHLKLYFLIGLPTEEPEDIEQIVELVTKIVAVWKAAGRKKGGLGTVTVSVNPFVPKPFTPLQWAGMDSDKVLKQKGRRLQAAFGHMSNTKFMMESVRSAVLQALLSRGDRRLSRLLPELAAGGNLKQLCRRSSYPFEETVTAERRAEETFPWEVIHCGVRREYLRSEYQRALAGRPTPPCAPGCRRCGVC